MAFQSPAHLHWVVGPRTFCASRPRATAPLQLALECPGLRGPLIFPKESYASTTLPPPINSAGPGASSRRSTTRAPGLACLCLRQAGSGDPQGRIPPAGSDLCRAQPHKRPHNWHLPRSLVPVWIGAHQQAPIKGLVYLPLIAHGQEQGAKPPRIFCFRTTNHFFVLPSCTVLYGMARVPGPGRK